MKRAAGASKRGPGDEIAKRARGGATKAAGRSGGRAGRQRDPSAAAAVPDIEECSFQPHETEQIRSGLLDWYDHNHRVLPWRRNPRSRLSAEALAAAAAAGLAPAPADLPLNDFIYYEWVSEVMCQQTQISRAAEYFSRWVAKWPDVQALAGASQEEVNEAWAGLGYYRRARFLLEGAKYVVDQLGGSFPQTAKELQKIPGVGEYTSAAIASIACGQREAVVDGNVIRVLARLRRLQGDPRSGGVAKALAALASALVDPERPGDFNQAVMELGATVCIPNAEPKCPACPVAPSCQAYQAQQAHRGGGGDPASGPRVTDYPTKVEKAEKREETVAVAVLQLVPPGSTPPAGLDSGAFLLVQRPKDGLLAGLWEFPSKIAATGGGASPSPGELQQQMSAYLQQLLGVRLERPGSCTEGGNSDCSAEGPAEQVEGGEGSGGSEGSCVWEVLERRQLGSLVHVFSHIRQTMVVEKLVVRGELPAAMLQPASRPAEQPGQEGAGEGGDTGAAGEQEQGQRPAMQWLSRKELEARGLSSGTAKVLKLAQKDSAAGKASITKFFKPVAGAAKAMAGGGSKGSKA